MSPANAKNHVLKITSVAALLPPLCVHHRQPAREMLSTQFMEETRIQGGSFARDARDKTGCTPALSTPKPVILHIHPSLPSKWMGENSPSLSVPNIAKLTSHIPLLHCSLFSLRAVFHICPSHVEVHCHATKGLCDELR